MGPFLAACLLLLPAVARGAPAWTIARDGRDRAVATAGPGATMNTLAAVVGLDARRWSDWVTLPPSLRLVDGTTATPKTFGPSQRVAAGETVEVPNSVIAAWIGDFGEAGRAAVDWESDLDYLRYRGFFVGLMEKPESSDHGCSGKDCPAEVGFGRQLAGALQGAAGSRDLHGFFVTSHGNCRILGTSETTLLRRGDLEKVYPLALVIINACYADTWRDLTAPGGKFHGPGGLMLPVLETGHPDELLAPGEQGTRRPPRRARPPRRTS